MGTIIEDLYDHEGYGARRLPDGTLTGTWSRETARFDAYVAACGCGWQGERAHPPTEEGYESAVDEWEHSHARPLLAETVPAGVDAAVRDAKQAIGRLLREDPAPRLGSWTNSGPGPPWRDGESTHRPWTRCAYDSTRWVDGAQARRSACSPSPSISTRLRTRPQSLVWGSEAYDWHCVAGPHLGRASTPTPLARGEELTGWRDVEHPAAYAGARRAAGRHGSVTR